MITRAQIRRQLRKNGGIMNAVPRQGYFLGGVGDFIGSALGKAKDVVSNVVKSPVGKAALLGLGAYYGGPSIMKGLGSIGPKIGQGLGAMKSGLFGSITPNLRAAGMPSFLGETGFTSAPGILGKLGLTKGGGSMGLTGLGKLAGGAGLLTYFMSKGKTEEEAKELIQDVKRGEGLGLDLIQADMKNYRLGALSGSQAYDKGYRFLTPKNYMQAATGGRAGFQDGTPAVDSRMQNTYAENIRQNNLQREINERARTRQGGKLNQLEGLKLEDRGGYTLNPGGGEANEAIIYSGLLGGRNPDEIKSQAVYDTFGPGTGNLMLPSDAGMLGPESFIKNKVQADYLAELMAPGSTAEYTPGGPGGYTSEQEAIADLGIERYNQLYAKGGRIGYEDGTPEEGIKSLDAGASSIKREGDVYPKDDDITTQMFVSDELGALPKKDGGVLPEDMGKLTITDFESKEDYGRYLRVLNQKAQGGRIGKYGGGVTATMPRIPTGMPRVNAGGISELDYRQEGGFVPMGVKEKADDVPAMLSKNEFVMTANAVKGAGGGNVEKGAQKMYNTMKQLEGRIA